MRRPLHGGETGTQILASALRASTLAVRFGLMFLLARKLPPAEVGLFALYASTLLLAASLLTLDVYSYSTRLLLLEHADRPRIIGQHLGFALVSTLLLTPITGWLLLASAPQFTWVLACLFCLHLPLEVVATEVGRLLVPLNLPMLANVVLFVRSAIWVIPLAAMLELRLLRVEVVQVIMCWFFGSVAGAGLALWFIWRAAGGGVIVRFDWRWTRGALAGSGLFLVATLLLRSVLGLDRFVIGGVLGVEALGVYSLFASVSFGVLGLIEAGVSAWRYPDLVKNIQSRDFSASDASLAKFVQENGMATLGLMVAITISFPIVTRLYLHPIYFDNIGAFLAVAAGVTLYCLSMPYHYVVYAFRRDYVLVSIYALSLLALGAWAALFLRQLAILGGGLMMALALATIAAARLIAARFLMRKARAESIA